ncbi:MAG: NAD(+)/NADH kinase [Candidatus Cloacimonetes bacterium]|nr:NAD(+)/NADH kinase [Candidatus Cloacimonadota bacterium]MCB5278968.1 NAD(+)/NADH kinase [Candidatus Cloacimonadota bacterium]MCK9332418.1 NAD(+)/NADH kinase [Candidatus Cloacimonadota bacterium]MDY0298313.1 NAD(+)/NADH kinase [Candidatus Cloacimonadaceae bacterium]
MKNFAVYINPGFADQSSIFKLLYRLKEENSSLAHSGNDLHFFGDSSQQDILQDPVQVVDFDGKKKVTAIDCILVFGGDGTILKAKEIALKTGAPILGINLGYLGFLSESTLPEISSSIRDLVEGRYKILSRMLINCSLKRKDRIILQEDALNDAVVYKGENPGLINARIFASGRYVFDARCDGVVVCTPTGSTAYSLSAGGPILAPQMKAMVLSPLNPHLLTIRPMVFPAEEKLSLKIYKLSQSASLQIDGSNVCPINEKDEIHISASNREVHFIKLSKRTFYRILRNKMHLGK